MFVAGFLQASSTVTNCTKGLYLKLLASLYEAALRFERLVEFLSQEGSGIAKAWSAKQPEASTKDSWRGPPYRGLS